MTDEILTRLTTIRGAKEKLNGFNNKGKMENSRFGMILAGIGIFLWMLTHDVVFILLAILVAIGSLFWQGQEKKGEKRE